jgi:hypothetical protein
MLNAVQIWGRLRRTFTQLETPVPLVTLRSAQTILSISLLQHQKTLRKCFSLFETEFDANALLLKIWRVFSARYVLSPYIKQTCLVFKGLSTCIVGVSWIETW